MASRWWMYQRERFPILAHGVLIAALSFSAVSVSAVLRGHVQLPDAGSYFVAFASAFVFFLQLRIADEFKDLETDARFRPYRPVPRGLISLRELGSIATIGMIIQLSLALWLHLPLALLLGAIWSYLGLMYKEFFARDWLTAHPVAYLLSHMVSLPLITFYATACEWGPAGASPPPALIWFLAASFFSGIVIEIGRKIRAPEDEEPGVDTYTVLWGRRKAVLTWLGAMLLASSAALLIAARMGVIVALAALCGLLCASAATGAWLFLTQPMTKRARVFEPISGLWTLVVHLALGLSPLLLRP
jgi:4-hydroxybenzoate polyprenyltransferase